uniref:cysteine protease ATG4D isoform X2 n=1 Tax=Ciona intestinalis TaxID=7719 RepID=UPI00089DBC9E|nr:cysteine protease ATG4D isoform X2 [Ciona intestinalis]|eukprot:XP_018668478.1 cysteine protease ATG4D isoform X2 [Ciona intestinalis]
MAFKSSFDELIKDIKSISFSNNPSNGETAQPASSKPDNGVNMKSKFLETWNNFRYDMRSDPSFKKDSPLWLLGKCYHLKKPSLSSDTSENAGSQQSTSESYNMLPKHLKLFLVDFHSKLWFTYRKGFPTLNDTNLTSDTGWGCMLRTAQMMIAQSFIVHLLGRNWRWTPSRLSMEQSDIHRNIITWFLDEQNIRCPFSLHQLTEIGLSYRCKPGNWYGPNTAAYIMQDALECAKGKTELLNNIMVYIAQDSTVYIDDVIEMCEWKNTASDADLKTSTTSSNRSVIVLIPVRLGEATLNPIYIPCIQSMLTLDQSVGIMGGKPKHSLYFIGFQDEYLFYLDPHYCQQADHPAAFKNDLLQNYHCNSPRKTNISKMDPSCCLGFYCRDYKDFQSFVCEANKFLSPPKQKMSYPLCLIMKGSALDHRIRRKSEADSFTVIPTSSDGFTEIEFNEKTFDTEDKTDGVIAVSDDESKASSSTDKFSFSLASTKSLLTNIYKSKSPKPDRKFRSMEEEFELL